MPEIPAALAAPPCPSKIIDQISLNPVQHELTIHCLGKRVRVKEPDDAALFAKIPRYGEKICWNAWRTLPKRGSVVAVRAAFLFLPYLSGKGAFGKNRADGIPDGLAILVVHWHTDIDVTEL